MVSIIIPIYNVERYIKRCLQSVMAQTYPGSMECILVDDCGTDRSIEIARRMIGDYTGNIKFKVLQHEYNRGLSAARNTGIKEATGDYITFVDSDDQLFPNSILEMATTAKKYPGVDLVQGDIKCERPIENKLVGISASYLPEYCNNPDESRRCLLQLLTMTACGKLIRRDFIIDNSLWFEEGLLHEDELWRIMMSRVIKSFACCFTPIYHYFNDNTSSITHQSDMTKRYLSHLRIAQYVLDNYDERYANLEFQAIKKFLHLDKKVLYWNNIPDKSTILAQIKQLQSICMGKNVDRRLKFMIRNLSVPIWLAKNKYYRFFYLYKI